MKQPYISLLICTYNRYDSLKETIRALSAMRTGNFELLIIDQGGETETLKAWVHSLALPFNNRIFHQHRKNLSAAWNFGISKARGSIVAFTDDDCIVDDDWMRTIVTSFRAAAIDAVFGRTLPYLKTRPSEHYVCPCVFDKPDERYISVPSFHHTHVGYSNNMAIRRKVFERFGGFKEWLGPGSIGIHCNDGEMILRMLRAGCTIYYNPRMRVQHNRWLTKKEYARQVSRYQAGEIAGYGYHMFSGSAIARRIVMNNFRVLLATCVRQGIPHIQSGITDLLSRLFCLGVAAYFSLKDPYTIRS